MNLDLEKLFDGFLDLDFVGCLDDFERDEVATFLHPHAFFGNDRTPNHFVTVHEPSTSVSFSSAPRLSTMKPLLTTSYTFT